MKIYIDTNTFPASPGIYADAAKTKPLPRIIPAVELERGGFEVAFLGDNAPQSGDVLAIAGGIENTRTQVIAGSGTPVPGQDLPTWAFDFSLGAKELVDLITARGSARVRIGIIATRGDNIRTEWQLITSVYATASGEMTTGQVESAKDFSELAGREAEKAKASAEQAAGSAADAA
ncbi:MAG: hypothetical protein IJW39_04370, partial [Opitutales bacterium]|nr:hypothetical protein [Opitutales bacterium]